MKNWSIETHDKRKQRYNESFKMLKFRLFRVFDNQRVRNYMKLLWILFDDLVSWIAGLQKAFVTFPRSWSRHVLHFVLQSCLAHDEKYRSPSQNDNFALIRPKAPSYLSWCCAYSTITLKMRRLGCCAVELLCSWAAGGCKTKRFLRMTSPYRQRAALTVE